MRALAVGTLGSLMWTPAASSRPAPLDGAPVIPRGVVLGADRTPGGGSLAVGGDMASRTAMAAESVWPSLLVGIDLVPSPEKPGSVLAKAAKSRPPGDSGNH